MHTTTLSLLALSLSTLQTTSALSLSTLIPRRNTCPSIWQKVATDLQSDFAGCGPDAHAAIRAPFHDCINNGCDGSLILTDECSRSENAGLTSICTKLNNWSQKYNVGAADIIQFAAATAIASCPLGPRVQALVGRKDSSVAAPVNSVPSSRDPPASIIAAFGVKGISAKELIALLGTHSVAQQFHDDPSQAGKSLDSTPGKYDITFYKETKRGTAPYSLQSDRLLSNYSQTAATWTEFSFNARSWSFVFTEAWNRFSVIGNNGGSLQDCSSLIPHSTASKERREANARFVERMSAKFRL